MSLNHSTPRPTPTPLCFINEPRLALLALAKLDEHEAAEVRAHLDGCEYCQVQVRQYEIVREAVARHFDSDTVAPRERTTPGSRRGADAVSSLPPLTLEDVMRASDTPRAPDATDESPRPPSPVRQHTPRQRQLTALGGIAAVLVLAVLAASLFSYLGGRSPAQPATPTAPTAKATASPTATPTPSAARAPLVVSDAPVARAISFAFVADNDVWVSLHGAQPRQVTHLGLDPGAQLGWLLLWSPDASQLLASASPLGSPGQAWLLSLPSGTVSPFPPLCLGPCFWLGERYIIYPIGGGTHYMYVQLYDVQQRRAVPTALDTQPLVEDLETRGSSAYFTPYPTSAPQPQATQGGVVKRFDLATNTITTAYVVPGALVSEGIPFSGTWDLSATGSRLVVSFVGGSTEHCPQSACYTYVQDSTGTVTMIFPTHQAAPTGGGVASVTISPDGKTAAGITGHDYGSTHLSLTQQALPSGNEITGPIPGVRPQATAYVLGWTAGGSILVREQQLDSAGQDGPTHIYAVAVGSADAPHLVETIQVTSQSGQPVTFAPTSAV